jgi:AcrR family transcriptional regulator
MTAVKSTRAEKTLRTRQRMLDSARKLIVGQGYAATTMEQIAAGADVAVQTTYYTFHTKGRLLCELMEAVAAGTDRPPAVMDRSWVAEMMATDSAHRALGLAVEHGTDIFARAAPLWPAIRAASATDQAVAEYWDGVGRDRREGMRRLAVRLAALGSLRAGLDVGRAGDLIVALQSHDTYSVLVEQAGWPLMDFKGWLYDTLSDQLLAGESAGDPLHGLSFGVGVDARPAKAARRGRSPG